MTSAELIKYLLINNQKFNENKIIAPLLGS
jgi:hypothetical protein